MSQVVFSTINPATTSGTQLATILNDFKNALMSGLTGATRPTELTAGGAWIDTSLEGSPDFLWTYKVWTGSVDITVFQINLATGTVSITGSDNTFDVTRISADAVGPLAKLVKRRIANNGQVLSGDVLGEIQFVGRGSDSSNPIVARIKSVSLDNMGASASGGYVAFEATTDNTATLIEMMRMIDGKLGVGTVAPDVTIHAVGTGIKSARLADDAVGAKLIIKKARIAGTGATQNSDVIGQVDFNTTDDATAENTAASMELSATQAHTASAQGSLLKIKVTKTGEATPTSQVEIGDSATFVCPIITNAQTIVSQDIATSAFINQLSATKALVRMTGSTATDIRGINSATGLTKVITIHNVSSATVTVKHADGTATAADRFDLPQSRDISIRTGSSGEFFYDSTASRWKVKSGSGGGGSGNYSTLRTLTADDTILSTDEVILLDGTSNPVEAILPPISADLVGKIFEIKRIDAVEANIVKVSGDGADEIDGEAEKEIPFQYGTIKLIALSIGVWGLF